MRALAFIIILAVVGCSDPASPWNPGDDPVPEITQIRTTPAWPLVRIDGAYSAPQYRITPDSAYVLHDNGTVTARYRIDTRANGACVWFATAGKEIAFLGAQDGARITGRITREQPNGRPGPIESITFEREQ